MKEVMGFALILIAILSLMGVVQELEKIKQLEAENEQLKEQVQTLETRLIDQLMRSQQND